MHTKGKDILGGAIAIGICEAVGIIGGLATASSVSTWYSTLQKPSFTPPDWVFAPVWTLLYALMGVAAYLVWRIGWRQRRVKVAIAAFIVQLALNLLWSILFFALRSPGIAMIDILLLLIAIVVTGVLFYRLRPLAGWLMAPYVLWVAYASMLNGAIVARN